MKKIIGIKFNIACTPQNIAVCSEISAECCRCLMQNYPVTYSQILYPYADALSLSGRKGTEGTRIFGTHAIFRGVDIDVMNEAVGFGVKSAAEKFALDPAEVKEKFPAEFTEFSLTDGSVPAVQLHEFLYAEGGEFAAVGDFGRMLSGFMPHWRIREAARVFASFSEMSYRKSGGRVFGLAGGKLAVSRECENIAALEDIFRQKTGC
ncbi:MAG: hypothetical protein PUB37_08410 [Firmicutes bacterium]|nr:hypothetical protein [Bacillota bacterium]